MSISLIISNKIKKLKEKIKIKKIKKQKLKQEKLKQEKLIQDNKRKRKFKLFNHN